MLELPLSSLRVGAANVRADSDMDDNLKRLIASIRSVGLLQPLVVTGDSNSGFEIIAGRRRFAALNALNEEGHAFDTVPCVLTDAETAAEASLAENYAREDMRPTQLWRAFATVLERNPDYEDKDLASAFDLPLDTVRRTLRLGRVHPEIIAAVEAKAFRFTDEAKILQAFAATEDQELQKQVYDSVCGGGGYVYDSTIKDALGVSADDFKLKVVGLDAYREAGGRFEQDLFSTHDNAGRILDPEILEGLATAKLCAMLAEKVGGDDSVKLSFKAPQHQYGGPDESLRLYGTPAMSDEAQAEYDQLRQRAAEIKETLTGDAADEIDDDAYNALKEERESALDKAEELAANAPRSLPPGRKIGVPSFKRTYNHETGDYDEHLVITLYWADKQAKKDAEKAARALAKAEGGEAAAAVAAVEDAPKPELTNKASDSLAAIRKAMLKQACAETNDELTPWRFVFAHAQAAAHNYKLAMGLKHIHTYDFVPFNNLKELASFEAFMAAPVEKRQAIAAVLLSSMIDNHAIDARQSFVVHQFGAKAEAEARRYWTPDADFFDMLKKQVIADMVAEVSPRLGKYLEGEKVASAKAKALDFFTVQKDDYKLIGVTEAELEAAKAFVPKWLRLAPPAPKAEAKPKAAKKPKAKKDARVPEDA